jgi:hypothetical protein
MIALMHCCQRFLNAAVDVWELAQVELHGRVSVNRIRKLHLFLEQTSLARAVAVCLAFPLPFVVVLAALEAIPLASPSAGTFANYGFWIRHVATLVVLSPGILSNFQCFLPELNITRPTILKLGVAGSIASGGSAFLVSLWIGFPVPFTLLVSAPGWLLVIIPPTIVIYVSQLRQDRALLWRFIRCWLVVSWLAVLVVLYPTYIFGFHKLGSIGQVVYVGLVPLIKMTGRNIFCWLIGDRHDVKAEIVIFNLEVLSALYMSVALQNSAKLTTTMAVIAVDIVQSKVAVSDIDKMMRGMDQIFLTTGTHRSNNRFRSIVFSQHEPTNDVEARALPPRNLKLTSVAPNPTGASDSSTGRKLPPASQHNTRIHPTFGPSVNELKHIAGGVSEQQSVRTAVPMTPSATEALALLSTKDQKQLAMKSARVLFTAEFVLLVKYVEATAPAIYGALKVAV